jgi:hypothetical protein
MSQKCEDRAERSDATGGSQVLMGRMKTRDEDEDEI